MPCNNQSAVLLPAFGGVSGLFALLTQSHEEGQSSMHIEQLSEVYQHNQPRPVDISLWTVGMTMRLSMTYLILGPHRWSLGRLIPLPLFLTRMIIIYINLQLSL